MKCTTSKLLTCRVTNSGPIWSAFYVVSQSKNNATKASASLSSAIFLTSQSWRDKWHVSWFNDFISVLSSETKPRPKSWPTLSIVWSRLYTLFITYCCFFYLSICQSPSSSLSVIACESGRKISSPLYIQIVITRVGALPCNRNEQTDLPIVSYNSNVWTLVDDTANSGHEFHGLSTLTKKQLISHYFHLGVLCV